MKMQILQHVGANCLPTRSIQFLKMGLLSILPIALKLQKTYFVYELGKVTKTLED